MMASYAYIAYDAIINVPHLSKVTQQVNERVLKSVSQGNEWGILSQGT